MDTESDGDREGTSPIIDPRIDHDASTDPGEALVLSFPARDGFLRVSRMTATSFGAGLGLDIDALDDLRLAVDEMVTWLLRHEECGGRVELVLTDGDGILRITGRRVAPDLPDVGLDDLVHAILGATVDGYDHGLDPAGVRFLEFTKRHS